MSKESTSNVVLYQQDNEDQFERIERFQPLQPGHYWRSTKNTQDGQGNEIAAETVLLLKSIKYVDDETHTIILHPHPSSGQRGTYNFLVNDFLAAFDPEPDGKLVREREMADIQREVNGLQEEMQQGQQDPAALIELARQHGYDDSAPSSPCSASTDTPITALVATGSPEEHLAAVRHQMANQTALATARANYLTGMTGKLSKAIQKLTPFYEEMGVVAMAQCEDVLAMAKTIMRGVDTLGLYTGKDVEVNQLCDGVEPPAGTPLSMFQRKLYMDEESLINIVEGGADYRDLGAFAKELSTNPALIERIIPAPRGVLPWPIDDVKKTMGILGQITTRIILTR